MNSRFGVQTHEISFLGETRILFSENTALEEFLTDQLEWFLKACLLIYTYQLENGRIRKHFLSTLRKIFLRTLLVGTRFQQPFVLNNLLIAQIC